MPEEKKEDQAENKPAENKIDEKKTEAQPADKVQAAPAPKAAAQGEKKEAEAPKKEKPSNCASCNKSIKKKCWYYRNGKFFCSKRCWEDLRDKEAKAKEATSAPENASDKK